MKCLYLHIDENGNVFYCGSGNERRPYDFNNRSDDWHSHREQFGLKEVKTISWHETKKLAEYNEEMMTDALREHGYSLVNKCSGRRFDDETKQKMSEVNLGKTLSEETKNKMSDARIGENNHQYGKSFEAGNFKGITFANNGFDKIIVFDGDKSMKLRGFDSGAISRCINSNSKSHLGFRNWKRTTDRSTLEALLSAADFYDEESKSILIKYLSSLSQD